MATEAGSSVSETTTETAATETTTEAAVETARTFTQDDVDRIVKDRVARAKAAPPPDYEELQAAAVKLAQLEESQKTELEKAQARAETAEKESERIGAEARSIRTRAAILSEAAKPDRKVVDPDLVATLLGPDLELDDQGNPTNVAQAMDSLLETRPYLVVQEAGARGNADQGARKGGQNQLSEADLKSMTAEQIVEARKKGRFTELGVAP